MKSITVAMGDRSYPIHIGQDILGHLGEIASGVRKTGAVALVTDSNVGPLYADRTRTLLKEAGFAVQVVTMPAGEEHKRLTRIDELCGAFLEAGLDRSSMVVALGGGVVGDVTGFAAASFMRGIPFIQIPTTIVAQVDSSVGGKTGVNHALAKNIIGAFHQPSAVLIDMTLLNTLPDRELRAGLAEAIKHGMIADATLFEYMEQRSDDILRKDLDALEYPVRRSCEIKAAVVAEDEHEHGVRAILNYGHTFGHGVEAVTHYGTYLHGEAVALGMHAAGALAHGLGMVDQLLVERQEACLRAYGLPVRWPELPVDETLAAMEHDKKARQGTLKFVVADRIGHVVQRTDVTREQARAALITLKE